MAPYAPIHRLTFWALLIIFRIVLDFSYIHFLNPIYSYDGYILDIKPMNYISSWLIYIPSFYIIRDRLKKPSHYFFLTAVLSVYAPLTSYYALTGFNVYPVAINLLTFFFIYLLTNSSLIKPIKVDPSKGGIKFSFSVSIISIITLIFWYIISGAVNYFNLDFTKVYEYRSLSSEVANIGFMSYFNGWVYSVFIFYAIAYTLLTKKYYLTFVLVLIQIFFYGVSAHKTVFFTPFIILSLWWYFRKYSSVLLMVISFSTILLTGTLLYVYNNEINFGSMFIRRVFFVPAKLTYAYIDFFQENEYILWSNSVLSWLVDYPYDDRMTKIVANSFGSEASANNGFIASGFAHFGVIGIIIYSYIIAFFLKNIDHLLKFSVPLWFILCLIVTPMRSFLISSDLPTSLLTHGFLIAFILLILSKKTQS